MKTKLYSLLLFTVMACAMVIAADEGSQPKLIKHTNPQYPAALKEAGVEGQAYVKAVVTEKGVVEKAEIVKATHPEFGDAALAAVKDWKFSPAMKDGKPVKAEVVIPVAFKLGDKKSK